MTRTPTEPPGGGYEVGRGRPPKATRFKKGVSGNPSGKRGAVRRTKAPFDRIFDRGIPMTIDGKRRRVTVRDFTHAQLVKMAGQGHLGAIKELNRMDERAEAARALGEPQEPAGPVQFNITHAPNRAHRALEVLGMVTITGGRMTLNLATVQHAVRQLGRQLEERDRMSVRLACPGFEEWYATLRW